MSSVDFKKWKERKGGRSNSLVYVFEILFWGKYYIMLRVKGDFKDI